MKCVVLAYHNVGRAGIEALERNGFEISAIFTHKDNPSENIWFGSVAELAGERGIPVFAPEEINHPVWIGRIRAMAPDFLFSFYYRDLVGEELLSIPKHGCINLHGSLLPKYRGAAPIQWAVLNGDAVTGVSTMYLDREMDTGDVIYTEQTPVGEFETAGELFDRLAVMGADLLVRTLQDIDAGAAPRTPQDHSAATYTRPLTRDDSPIDWDQSPRAIIKHICGLEPWPVATAQLGGQTFKIHAADYSDRSTRKAPGTIVAAGKDGVTVACADGQTVRITQLQAPGKKRMSAADYLLGHTLPVEG